MYCFDRQKNYENPLTCVVIERCYFKCIVHPYGAELPLSKVRQLYFRLKPKVFAKARFGVVYSAQELEKILKEVFGNIRMDQVQKPK